MTTEMIELAEKGFPEPSYIIPCDLRYHAKNMAPIPTNLQWISLDMFEMAGFIDECESLVTCGVIAFSVPSMSYID